MSTKQMSFPLFVRVLLGLVAMVMLAAAALLVVVGLLVAGMLWPGSQIDTLRTVGDDSVAVVHLSDASDDPGVRMMFEQAMMTFLETAQRVELKPSESPPAIGWRHRPGSSVSWPGRWMMRVYVPRDATLVLDPDPAAASGLTAGGAANFQTMVRLVRMVLENAPAEGQNIQEGDKIFIRLGSGSDGYLSFDEGTVFWGGLEQLRQLRARAEADTSPLLAEDVMELRADWPLVGVTRELGGLEGVLKVETVALALAPAGDVMPMDDVTFERAWFGARVPDGDTVQLKIVIEGVSPEGAELLELVLKSHCEKLRADVPLAGVQMECTSGSEGEDILLLDARWSNIQAALAADMERTMREQKEREALEHEDRRL